MAWTGRCVVLQFLRLSGALERINAAQSGGERPGGSGLPDLRDLAPLWIVSNTVAGQTALHGERLATAFVGAGEGP